MNENILEGIVEDIVFTNRENGYTICTINCMGEPVTLVGIMPLLGEGETIRAQGSWTVHPTFGRQFRVDLIERSLPASAESIRKYLSSGAIKGIGPVLAERITAEYGEETLDVIEHHPRWLCDIKGISPKKADEIHNKYQEQFGMRSIMLYFNRFLGPTLSAKIYKQYGSAAIDLVEQNPYRLCKEIDGLGFEKADAIAQSIGTPADSEDRIDAGIIHVLYTAAYQSGHCKLPEELLLQQSCRILSVDESRVFAEIVRMDEADEIIRTADSSAVYYALPELHSAERYCSAKLLSLATEPIPFRLDGLTEKIHELEQKYDITYADEQVAAIKNVFESGLTILTGGPGTGKTTVINAILSIFDDLKFSCSLAAPTGRAAKRMSEATGREAKTIHRLLESSFIEGEGQGFMRDENNPLTCKALIIDEMSMVDVLLLESLLKAVRLGTYVILIGDADQLPPVGPGNCLSTLISSGKFQTICLKKIFRQAEQSLIVTNAHRINRGEMPVLNDRSNDFFFMERHGAETVAGTILDLCTSRLPQSYGVDPLKDIQVLCFTRKGPLGTIEMNAALQAAINPPQPSRREKKVGSRVFREHDKVMQIRNNYDLTWEKGSEEGEGIFNGDIGTIQLINMQGEYLRIDFDGRICDYDFSLLEDLELAYAITTHKSQGSEYRFVVIPAFEAAGPLMTRNLLYTAVTRAREFVCMIGSPRVISKMVVNDKKPFRYSSMGDFLSQIESGGQL